MALIDEQFEYTFDEIGNRTQTKAGGDSGGNNLRSATCSSNLLNQYTSLTVPDSLDFMGYEYGPFDEVGLGTLIGCEPIEMPLGTCVSVIEGNLDSRRIKAPAEASMCVWETTKDSFSATVVQGNEGTYLSIQRTAKGECGRVAVRGSRSDL